MEEIYQILQCLHKISKKGKQDEVITVFSFSRRRPVTLHPEKLGRAKTLFFLEKSDKTIGRNRPYFAEVEFPCTKR